MKAWASLGSGGQAAVVAAAVAVIGAAGWFLTRPAPEVAVAEAPRPAAPAPVAVAEVPVETPVEEPAAEIAATPEAAPDPAPEEIAEVSDEVPAPEAVAPDVAAPEEEAAEAAPGVAPADAVVEGGATAVATLAIENVRVDDFGMVVVSGRSDPMARVIVLVDGDEAATVEATRRGEFASIFTLVPSAAPRMLTLEALLADGRVVVSENSVLIAPRPGAEVAAVGANPGADLPGRAADMDTDMAARDPAASEAPVAQEQAPEAGETEVALAEAPLPEAPLPEAALPEAVVPETASAETASAETAGTETPGTETVVAETVVADAATAEAPVAEAGAQEAQTQEQTQEIDIAEAPKPDDVTLEVMAPEVLADLPLAEAPAAPADSPAPPVAPVPVPSIAAPAVIVASGDGVRMVQAPQSDAPPQVLQNVVIDTISYSPGGDVVLAGRGSGDRVVRIYLNNQPLGDVAIAADGNWRADFPDIDTGVYTLRADEIDGAGRVTSRFETPFQREAPEVIAAAPARGARAEVVTVQPGFTLWGISRETYGEGILYVQVFEANRDQIRNPDLIYPGQVFRLPEIGPAQP